MTGYPQQSTEQTNLDWMLQRFITLLDDWNNLSENYADFKSTINAWVEETDQSIDDLKQLINDYLENPTEETAAFWVDIINNWLAAHPEYSTTVMDGSLTKAKFSEQLKLETIKDYVTPKMFGAVGDGISDDTQAIQAAVNSARKVVFDSAIYYISEPIELHDNLIMDGNGCIIKSDKSCFIIKATSTTLNINAALNEGENSIVYTNFNITNEMNAILTDNTNFCSKWSDTPIRDYYLNGQLFTVKSNTEGIITFNESSKLTFNDGVKIEYFIPVRNITIYNFDLQCQAATDTTYYGIRVGYASNVKIDNVKCSNYYHSGIGIEKSEHIEISDIGIYSQASSNLNYGISVVDGSCDISINNVVSYRTRHSVTGGTSGHGIPMNVVATNIFAYESIAQAFETHGATMNFTYMNCYGEGGVSMSGIGHIARNIKCTRGTFMINEGGYDILYDNIEANVDTFNFSYACKKITYQNCNINLADGGRTYINPALANMCEDIKYINCNISKETTNYTEDNMNAINLFGANSMVQNTNISNFPRAIYCIGNNCVIDNLTITNCGYRSGSEDNGAIQVHQSSNNFFINNIRFLGSYTNINRHLYLMSATEVKTGTITNIISKVNARYEIDILGNYRLYCNNIKLNTAASGRFTAFGTLTNHNLIQVISAPSWSGHWEVNDKIEFYPYNNVFQSVYTPDGWKLDRFYVQ